MFGRKKKQNTEKTEIPEIEKEKDQAVIKDEDETSYLYDIKDLEEKEGEKEGVEKVEEEGLQESPQEDLEGDIEEEIEEKEEDKNPDDEGREEPEKEEGFFKRRKRERAEKKEKKAEEKERKRLEREEGKALDQQDEDYINDLNLQAEDQESHEEFMERLNKKRRGKKRGRVLRNFFLIVLSAYAITSSLFIYKGYNRLTNLEADTAQREADLNSQVSMLQTDKQKAQQDLEAKDQEIKNLNQKIAQYETDIENLNNQIKEKDQMIESLSKNVQAVNDSFNSLMDQAGGGSTEEKIQNLESAIEIMNRDPNSSNKGTE